ncbi:MAG: four helix bundle protein [Bacteroidetes bacterium HGW-Bacteroidetes-3]|jgi:four helix bundle protein|nr:MAG: four helix bundle protein [Bacteroidetes bacterium HGW-Bacteroidetes-3]
MKEYSFEKLEVWQLSRKLVKLTYSITTSFPEEEKFGIINQMRRAAISVSSNISEGSSRNSYKDQARFTVISYGSLMELLNQYILSNDLEWINNEDLIKSRILIEEISNKLNGLRNYQLSK